MLVNLGGKTYEVIQGSTDIQRNDIVITGEMIPCLDDDFEETGEEFLEPRAYTVDRSPYPEESELALVNEYAIHPLENFQTDFVILRPV